MSFKEKINGLDEVSDFVDENENKLREVVPEIIKEECIKDRVTERQGEILRMYYVENRTHDEIAKELDLKTEEVLDKEDRAFKGILVFANICGLKSLFEDDLLKKLRSGDEAIKKTMREIENEKIFTKEEMEIIHNHFYVLKGIGEKKLPHEKISSQTMVSKTLSKVKRLFFARYKPPEF